jgi:hypothetical protein
LAWLHSAPQINKSDKAHKSRISKLEDDHPAKQLPESDLYLTLCFGLLGYCLSNGMGTSPISWVELKAFSDQSGYHLNGWQSEQIIQMSRDYCSMSVKASEQSCPAPYREGVTDEESKQLMRDRVNKEFDKFFK